MCFGSTHSIKTSVETPHAITRDHCSAAAPTDVSIEHVCLSIQTLQRSAERHELSDGYCAVLHNLDGMLPLGLDWAAPAEENRLQEIQMRPPGPEATTAHSPANALSPKRIGTDRCGASCCSQRTLLPFSGWSFGSVVCSGPGSPRVRVSRVLSALLEPPLEAAMLAGAACAGAWWAPEEERKGLFWRLPWSKRRRQHW